MPYRHLRRRKPRGNLRRKIRRRVQVGEASSGCQLSVRVRDQESRSQCVHRPTNHHLAWTQTCEAVPRSAQFLRANEPRANQFPQCRVPPTHQQIPQFPRQCSAKTARAEKLSFGGIAEMQRPPIGRRFPLPRLRAQRNRAPTPLGSRD